MKWLVGMHNRYAFIWEYKRLEWIHEGVPKRKQNFVIGYSLSFTRLHFYRLRNIHQLRHVLRRSKQCWNSCEYLSTLPSCFLHLFNICKLCSLSDDLWKKRSGSTSNCSVNSWHAFSDDFSMDKRDKNFVATLFIHNSSHKIRRQEFKDTPSIWTISSVVQWESSKTCSRISWGFYSFRRSMVVLNEVGFQARSDHF